MVTLSAIANNLPLPLSSFIGRELEIAEVQRLLASARLVTLTGVGGVGKTRLSLEVAAQVVADFHDGVWFVDFSSLSDPALVPQVVAATVGLTEQAGRQSLLTLADYLHPRAALLILDNCEHLVGACAQLAEHVGQACPRVRVLATSREALGIRGEMVWPVPALQTPDLTQAVPLTPEQLMRYESVRLFVERAQAALPRFSLTAANTLAVAQICWRLDGIPLAIELAAARIKLLPAEQILSRLDDRFRLLTGGSRTVLPRQQTLQALIDWSYDLLAEPERVLLRRLSVFAGRWTLEAAETVCADAVGTDVLECLAHLVDKSLVEAEERTGSARYRMLETIRQYAHEKLLESSEGPGLHDRHLDYFARLGAEAELKLRGRELGEWLDRLESEIDNIRSALSWSRETGRIEAGLSLATSLYWFWYIRRHRTEGLDWLQSLLAQPAPVKNTIMRGRALCRLASAHDRHGNYDAARLMAGEALAIGQELHDQPLIVSAYGALAEIAYFEGNRALAGSMSEQALALSRAAGDRYQIGSAALMAGFVAVIQGAYVRAEQALAECVQLMQEFGDKNMLSTAARFWGYALLYQGNDTEAATKFRESLTLNWELRDKLAVGACLAGYAALAVVREDYQHAARLLGATEHVCESINEKLPSWDKPFYDHTMIATRAHLDKATFETAWAEGHALTLEQAIAAAAQLPVPPGPAETHQAIAPEWGGLSERERAVALLVAQGLSNREIAETLVLSRRTVETHVANIFNKMGFSSRAQVRQWARDKLQP